MKRKLLSVLVALSALIFASCSFNQAGQQEEKNGSKSAYIKIDASNARNALPVVGNVADFDSFVLTGTTDTASLAINKTWATAGSEKAYAKMTADSIAVTVGKSYDFTLTATKGGAVLSGTLTKAIAAGQNSLSFTLSPSSYATDGKGNLSIELSVPDAVQAVSAKLYKSDVEVTPEGAACTFANAKATYTANTIDSGNYVLVFTLWGDAAKTLKLGEWREYAGITKDLTSSSTPAIASNSELESIYTITLNYDGGSLSGTFSGSYTRYSDDITLPTADLMTKFGHTFAGWKIGDEAVTTIAKGTVGNITVTATWTANANFVTSERLATMQQSITSAAAGGSVTLSPANGIAPQGSTLNISKALTVDGNGIEGLTINVSSAVQSNITLKNFKNAKLQVVAPAAPQTSTSVNRARAVSIHDTENEDGEKIEKFGDDALPLRLEGCEIKEFVIEDEVALYLGTGEEKTTIEELKLDLVEGAEKFTFIENDKDIDEEDRSSIEKLRIEDGLKEINLIGGSFDDVDFADDFSFEDDKLKFNYDPEFEQFKDDDFLRDEEFKEMAEPRDIALAKYEVDENTNGTGVYKFEMTLADFQKLNGYMDVIFMNEDQADVATGVTNMDTFWRSATYENPMYSLSLMGDFKTKAPEEGTTLLPIYGANPTYFDYSNAFYGCTFGAYVSKVYLENYLVYSKDAVVFKIDATNNKVYLYVNMAAIKKEDVTVHVAYNYDDTESSASGILEGGSKLTKVDLSGYKPYFIINVGSTASGQRMGSSAEEWNFLYGIDTNAEGFNWEGLATMPYGSTAVSFIDNCLSKNDSQQTFPKNAWVPFPISGEQKSEWGEPLYYPFAMTETEEEYPDVSELEITPWPVADITYVKVKYYTDELLYISEAEVVRENINPVTDFFEYYKDSGFEYKIPQKNDSFTGALDWNYDFRSVITPDTGTENPDGSKQETVIYARPRRNVTFVKKQWNSETQKYGESYEPIEANMGLMNFPNLTNLTPGVGGPFIFYRSYDAETNTFSNKITSPKEVRDWDVIFLVDPYVTLVITDPADATKTYEVGTVNISKLPVQNSIHFYRTAEMNNDDYYTSHTRDQELGESLGKKVYFEYPVSIMYPDCYTVKQTITYMDFAALLADADNTESYYKSSMLSAAFTDPQGIVHPAQTAADVTFTAENLPEYLAGKFVEGYDSFFISTPFTVYTALQNNIVITGLYTKNGTDQSPQYNVGALLTYFDRGIATLYSGAEKTDAQLLSRAAIAALENNSSVYIKWKTFKYYSIATAGVVPGEAISPNVYDYDDLMVYFFNQYSLSAQTDLYADAALTQRLSTVDAVLALADGSYIYGDCRN